MVHNLSLQNSILNQFIAELRDVEMQKDSMRFRKNLERLGEIFAYEISKTLAFKTVETTTPLGVSETKQINSQPVLATILRAGLPFHAGFLNIFDQAENGFVGAYRKEHKNNNFEIVLDYFTSPDLNNKTLILCDPMLASGLSIVKTYQAMLSHGTPSHIHLACAIASSEGITYVKTHMPSTNFTIWCGAIDEELTAHAYIVPGLGDAGDLAFGNKL
ncbi:MAG: uracil phosphoribosyltransferase [Bacteroidota bacterium]